GTEFAVLLSAPEEELRKTAHQKVAEGILLVRQGRVRVEPGYDGEYGTVRLFEGETAARASEQQMTLF
ncbi:MAG: DNA helicase UvrD, partial [Candidatus Omnitrophica bacterium]|nr:DNA helicase UvrD [Candidatus Omnitrophota bacterium]